MANKVLVPKSEEFSLRIIKLYKYLQDEKREFVRSKQLLRSGTSIGANLHEAIYAQSTADFVSKYHISLKEASETAYWLRLPHKSQLLTDEEYKSIIKDCDVLIRLLTSSLKTIEQNKNK